MSGKEEPDALNPAYLFENDWLHPNAQGYQLMGNCIDLNLF
jgi:lysophospholipase L1-like esterase